MIAANGKDGGSGEIGDRCQQCIMTLHFDDPDSDKFTLTLNRDT